jgi:hypothetical protein
MAEERKDALWKHTVVARILMDLALLPVLAGVAYVLFRSGSALQPLEATCLMVLAVALVALGRHWWEWQRGLLVEGMLGDWVRRILRGEREPSEPSQGLRAADGRISEALNLVLHDTRRTQEALARLDEAASRDWKELDELLEALEQSHEAEREDRAQGLARMVALGQELKTALEGGTHPDHLELNQRLRADQHRLQGQSFRATLGQVCLNLDHFEAHLEELLDTFPRLRREEDALGRLADTGLRQGAHLTLAMRGLVAHTPRLLEENQARQEYSVRFRQAADGVRDQTEALSRRIETFREEAQQRIRAFSGAQANLKGLDQVAHQTGLLAVNAAILAQQGGGSAGLAAIGGRLRSLADQAAGGASELEQALNRHQQGLERETISLWDLQEVTVKMLSSTHELLRMADHLDQQSHGLERSLEAHIGLVDQVRQASERAELSLCEIGERAAALESAHGRQWGVEAKLVPEQKRLARAGGHLGEVGEELARISEANMDEIWAILARHQRVRRSEAYRRLTSEDLADGIVCREGASTVWHRVSWARAQRRVRLARAGRGAPKPTGRRDADGGLRLLLLGQDALNRAEPSALEAWSCDVTGQVWQFRLQRSLQKEGHRLTLLEALKAGPLSACFPGLTIRITPEGVEVRLPSPYPAFPDFLAGLGLELEVEAESWEKGFREPANPSRQVQYLLWVGPGSGGGLHHPCLRLVHDWVRDDPDHERFLPWLPHDGPRLLCPHAQEGPVPARLETTLAVRCVGLDADAALLAPYRDRLRAAGATEGVDGVALCAVAVGHAHPETLLLRLFQAEVELAGALHPDLIPYQLRLKEEVLSGASGDPYQAAWTLLEDLQREGWVLPLPKP